MPSKMPTSRDIDKEEMFRKIMPSATQTPAPGGAGTVTPGAGSPTAAPQAMPADTAIEAPSAPATTGAEGAVATNLAAAGAAETTPAPAAEPDPPPSTEPLGQTQTEPAPASGNSPEKEAQFTATSGAPSAALSANTPVPEATGEAAGPPATAASSAIAESAAMPESPVAVDQDAAFGGPLPNTFPAALGLDDSGDIHPVNLVEILMDRYYPRYCQRLAGCDCQRCKDDVYGMALNKVTPRYVRSDQVREEDLANRELVSETVTALMQALFAVKNNPHHDENRPARQ